MSNHVRTQDAPGAHPGYRRHRSFLPALRRRRAYHRAPPCHRLPAVAVASHRPRAGPTLESHCPVFLRSPGIGSPQGRFELVDHCPGPGEFLQGPWHREASHGRTLHGCHRCNHHPRCLRGRLPGTGPLRAHLPSRGLLQERYTRGSPPPRIQGHPPEGHLEQ